VGDFRRDFICNGGEIPAMGVIDASAAAHPACWATSKVPRTNRTARKAGSNTRTSPGPGCFAPGSPEILLSGTTRPSQWREEHRLAATEGEREDKGSAMKNASLHSSKHRNAGRPAGLSHRRPHRGPSKILDGAKERIQIFEAT